MAKNSTTGRIFLRTIQTVAPPFSRAAPGLAAHWLGELFTRPQRFPTPAREQAWLLGARRAFLDVGGGRRVATYTWGREDNPTALLVHGWAARGSQLGVYAAPLVARGYRVVAFDQPAHGRSSGRRTALPQFADAVEQVAGAIGPVSVAISHSLGCAATNLAVSRGVPVGRLVHLAPPERVDFFLERAGSHLGFSSGVRRRAMARVEARFGLGVESARGRNLAPRLGHIPLLIVHDSDDRDVPLAEGRALAQAWPAARLTATSGLGHTRVIRDPEVVETVVRFAAAPLEPRATVL